jgi:hypothetical protein
MFFSATPATPRALVPSCGAIFNQPWAIAVLHTQQMEPGAPGPCLGRAGERGRWDSDRYGPVHVRRFFRFFLSHDATLVGGCATGAWKRSQFTNCRTRELPGLASPGSLTYLFCWCRWPTQERIIFRPHPSPCRRAGRLESD